MCKYITKLHFSVYFVLYYEYTYLFVEDYLKLEKIAFDDASHLTVALGHTGLPSKVSVAYSFSRYFNFSASCKPKATVGKSRKIRTIILSAITCARVPDSVTGSK